MAKSYKYISTSGLKTIATNIDKKRDEIMALYKNTITSLLNQSKEAIVVSGLDYDELIKKFGNTFSALDERLGSLSDVLVNKIIPNYDDLSNEIKNAFNKDFASQMTDIMKKL